GGEEQQITAPRVERDTGAPRCEPADPRARQRLAAEGDEVHSPDRGGWSLPGEREAVLVERSDLCPSRLVGHCCLEAQECRRTGRARRARRRGPVIGGPRNGGRAGSGCPEPESAPVP